MKNTIITIIALVSQLVSCQTIMPLNTYPIPNGAYIKDIDHTFDRFIGTWEGTLNNKKYTFVFTKFTQHLVNFSSSYSYFQDELMGIFKVTDLSNNQVIYDNTNAINYEDYRIYGTHPHVLRGMCSFFFVDTNANCNNTIDFILKNTINNNQLLYYMPRYGEWVARNCPPTTDRMTIPVFLPMQELILTKL